MSDINWGILQPINQSDPIRTATPSAPSAPVGSAPNPTSGLEAAGQMQQQATERGKLAIMQQENQRAQQLQPGLLQQQQLANQGQGLTNTKSQQEIGGTNYAIKVRSEMAKAFQEGKVKGGAVGGLEAGFGRAAELGDIDTAMKGYQSIADLQKKLQDNNKEGVLNSGDAVFGIMKAAKPPVKDPKTGQIIDPGKTPLQVYTEQYPELKKRDASLPEPKSFRDNQQFEDAYVHPTLEVAGPIAQQRAADIKAKTEQDLYKAQQVVQQRQEDLKQAIKNKGPKSQEALDAATIYQQAQREATRVSIGGGTGSLGVIERHVYGPDKDVNTLIQEQTGKSSEPAKASTGIPEGRVQVTSPDGQVGHIPAGQLQDALKSGYTESK